MRDSPDQSFEQIREQVHMRIREQAPAAFSLLERKGCDAQTLLRFLGHLTATETQRFTRQQQTGFDRKGLSAAIRNMRHCARLLKDLYNHPLGGMVYTMLPLYERPVVLRLPDILSEQADAFEAHADNLPHTKSKLRTFVIAALMTYIREATGHFHDNELAALISATEGRDFTTDALKMLRRDNRKLISECFEAHHQLGKPTQR